MSPPFQKPPAAASFHGTVTRRYTSWAWSHGSLDIRVNGDAVVEGPRSAEVLGLLGIDPEAIDVQWRLWASMFYNSAPGAIDGGWQLVADVVSGAVHETRDLAYIDQRNVKRRLRFTLTRLGPDAYGRPMHDDAPPRDVDLDDGGAIGAFYSGVDDDEIDSTVKAANALIAARQDLERAVEEIEIAIKVADAAWKGTRAEVAKTKFALELLVNEGLRDIVHGWEDFTQDVVRDQRVAKEQDNELKAEIAKEVGITILIGALTLGFGAAVKATLFFAKLAKWAREIDVIRRAMATRLADTLARLGRTTAATQSVRVVARASADFGVRTTVGAATGHPNDTNWFESFIFAGVIGQATSEGARVFMGLRSVETRLGVKLMSPAEKGATKGALQGVPRSAASYAYKGDAAESALSYAIGVPSEAAKEVYKRGLKTALIARLSNDPVARQTATRTVLGRFPGRHELIPKHKGITIDGVTYKFEDVRNDPALLGQLVDREIAAMASRQVDPIADFAFGAAARSTQLTLTNHGDRPDPVAPRPVVTSGGLVQTHVRGR